MSDVERIERALASPQPVFALRDSAIAMHQEGADQQAVLDRFETVRAAFREADREADEDLVTAGMEIIDGWCSPHMKIEW